jgi:hypothetical protein
MKTNGCNNGGESSNNLSAVHKTSTTAPHDYKQHNQTTPHEVLKQPYYILYPDDAHNDARNMLIYFKKYIFSPLLHPLVFI